MKYQLTIKNKVCSIYIARRYFGKYILLEIKYPTILRVILIVVENNINLSLLMSLMSNHITSYPLYHSFSMVFSYKSCDYTDINQ